MRGASSTCRASSLPPNPDVHRQNDELPGHTSNVPETVVQQLVDHPVQTFVRVGNTLTGGALT